MNLDLAWQLYNDGGYKDSLEIFRSLVHDAGDENPDTRACLALSHLRLGEHKVAMKYLKPAARGRPDGWIIGVLKRHIPDLELGLDALFHLGRFLNQGLPIMGPPSQSAQSDGVPRHMVNVLGSSHARSFGAHPVFFPVFIGIAHTTLLLTDSLFAATREKFLTNLARLDRSRDLLVVLGSDARLHWKNEFDTREAVTSDVTDHDLECMHRCAVRHKQLIEEVMQRVSGRVVLYNALPTFESRVNELTMALNSELSEICAEIGAGFLDIWEQVTDPELGILRREFAAQAFQGDMHLNGAAVPLIVDGLKEMGSVDGKISREEDFCGAMSIALR